MKTLSQIGREIAGLFVEDGAARSDTKEHARCIPHALLTHCTLAVAKGEHT